MHVMSGFDEARRIMMCHEARARVLERLELTRFVDDLTVTAVHVDNTTRADRVHLTAFDATGRECGFDTLYIDEPTQRLDVTPEFDHDFTRMSVPDESDLQRQVDSENGWVIDMSTLREYELFADRQETQRAVFLAHLQDMLNSGQARGFLLGLDESSAD